MGNPGWRSTLVRGASGALAVQVAGAALGFATHVVLARILGRQQYGVYALALTWMTFLLIPALLGQSTSVLRFAPAYIQRREWGRLRALLRCSNLVVFGAAAAIGFGGAALVWAIRSKFETGFVLTFLIAFLALPALALLQLSGALHQSLKRPVSAGFFNYILRPVVLILILVVWIKGLRAPPAAFVAMAASAFGALAALGASALFLRAAWPAEARTDRPAYELREWLRTGHRLLFVDGIGVILNRIDVILLGGLQGTADLGCYYAAVQIATVGSFGLSAVNTILAPMIAERYAAGDHDGLAGVTADAARLILVFSAFVLLGGILFGRSILGMFGAGFETAYGPLLIMLGGQFLNAACGPVGFLMSMTRHEGTLLKVFGLGAALNVGLSAALIPGYGMYGAAVASATATVAWNVVAIFLVRGKLGINPCLLPMLSPCPRRTS